MTTTTLSYRGIHNKITSINLPKIRWKLIYFLSVLFLLLMLVFYIFGINELTKGAYLIKNYNKEINSLSEESRILEAQLAKSGFLVDVQNKVKELIFEKTTEVTYVQILENSLGMAK